MLPPVFPFIAFFSLAFCHPSIQELFDYKDYDQSAFDKPSSVRRLNGIPSRTSTDELSRMQSAEMEKFSFLKEIFDEPEEISVPTQLTEHSQVPGNFSIYSNLSHPVSLDEEARMMQRFAAAAYCRHGLETWTCKERCRQGEAVFFKRVFNHANAVEGYVAYSPLLDSILVVFRGTKKVWGHLLTSS